MKQSTLVGRLVSPAGFALLLIMFAMPFVTVSCGNEAQLDSTFTGTDMIVGGQPAVTGEVGGDPVDEALERELLQVFAEDIDLQPFALLAALTLLFGVGVGILRERVTRHATAAVIATVAAGLTAAAVAAVRSRVDDAMTAKVDLWGDNPPPTAIEPRFGFWLVMVGLTALAAGNAWFWLRLRRAGEAVAAAADQNGPSAAATYLAAPDVSGQAGSTARAGDSTSGPAG